MDDVLQKLNDLVKKEIDKIVVKGNITPAELELATKAVCLIEKIKMAENPENEMSYSRNGGYVNGMQYSRNDGWNNDMSNRSYGRMSNNSYRDYYIAERDYGYPMDRGYSSHSVKDRMISQLETTMMDNAKSENEKRVIESLISQLSSGEYK